jgi:hypothetical protein
MKELCTGLISADGKLTLAIPSTVADDKLFHFDESDALGGILLITPSLYLVKGTESLSIVYLNKDTTAQGMSLKKGWNYISNNANALVTDISGYKWAIYQSGN